MADQVNYQVVESWEQLPKGFAQRDVAGVAVDQEDRVFLICRGENPVMRSLKRRKRSAVQRRAQE